MKIQLSPKIKDIKPYTKKGNFLPVYVEISSGIGTPINCFDSLKKENVKYPFLFESLDTSSHTSRYTILGFNPRRTFLFTDEKNCLVTDYKYDTKENIAYDSPFDILRAETKKFTSINIPKLPTLTSGLIGYLGYDTVQSIYKIPKHKNIEQKYPLGFFGMYKDLIVFDNLKQGKIQIISNIYIPEGITQEEFEKKQETTKKHIEKIIKIICKPYPSTPIFLSGEHKTSIKLTSNSTEAYYKKTLLKLKQDLIKGDVFQTIISEVFSFDLKNISKTKKISGIDIYRGLRHVNPASYMFYFELDDFSLIGSVPETFVRVNDNKVLTRPLAGTRGVGKNKTETARLRKELITDEKERAEHAMLIDLIRNDLSKNCEPGSIQVKKKMYVKKYNHVMHIVSDVVGKIDTNKDFFDVFSGIFPHGNVTGAPKISAMNLINKYEPTNRGIYSGAIGYFGFNGNADFAVLIRTIIKKNDILYNQVGSGIVIDFIPENEIKEHKNKNKTFIKLIELLYTNFS